MVPASLIKAGTDVRKLPRMARRSKRICRGLGVRPVVPPFEGCLVIAHCAKHADSCAGPSLSKQPENIFAVPSLPFRTERGVGGANGHETGSNGSGPGDPAAP